MTIRQIVAPILIILLGLLLAIELPQAIASRDRDYDWYTPVIDVRTLLHDRYVREIDVDAMQQAALSAMVDSLDDPHSVYIPPRDTSTFEKEMSGRYTGIGAEIRPVDDRLMIITPLDGSPALEAGLRAGDVINEIDGTDTLGLGPDACIDLLLGEPGTEVVLHIARPDGTTKAVTVVRGAIAAPTLEGLIRRDGNWTHWIDEPRGMAYVELDQFTDSTAQELRGFLEIHAEALRGLVIDLRGNPGGALPAAIDAADQFIADGPLVHIRPQRDDRVGETHTYSARPGHAAELLPVVVLVDQHSASASEILAGALADRADARIMGERTFGKGSVQELRPLDEGKGLVKFTTALYALPGGRIIERDRADPEAPWGVDPSPGCIVPETEVDRLARIRAREPWRVIAAEEPELMLPTDAQWARETLKDPGLAEAIDLLADRLDAEDWPTLPPDTDQAFAAPSADLDSARNARTLLLERLDAVDREILRLTQAGVDSERGFATLDRNVSIGSMDILIRDADGNVLGTWQAVNPEVARAALAGATLAPVDDES